MEKPTFKQRMNSFLKFVWNGETGEFLGRGARSWAEIGAFYLIYYACLAGFFAATIAVFYQTIDSDRPRLQGSDSLLKANPGMGYQPMPDIDTTLIYARSAAKDNKEYVDSINKVLKAYKSELSHNKEDCTDIQTARLGPESDKACHFNYSALTMHCNEENAYGMKEGKPCVLLKLNKIFGWVPRVWTKEEAQDVRSIPQNIKDHYTPDRIWIDCHGENPADNDNMGIDPYQNHADDDEMGIKYYPMQGFPLAFYPYMKQKDYRSPLVFVKFNNLTHHLALMIECKALAKNIAVDRSEKEGSVHFEMLVEP